MIDIHSHIVWGIDDGIQSEEEMKEAFQMAKDDGIEIICSTPHITGYQIDDEKLEYIKQQQRRDRIISEKYGIQLAFGCELFLNDSVYECIESNHFLSLNQSKYILCEFDVRKDIHKIEDFNEYLYEIEINGYIPVIAHVERYFLKGLDYKILEDWKDKGYVFQVNRTSLLGIHGKTIQKNAKLLLKKRYAHVISSDCHSVDGKRISKLSDIYIKIQREYGKEYADLLCIQNPYSILCNLKVRSFAKK